MVIIGALCKNTKLVAFALLAVAGFVWFGGAEEASATINRQINFQGKVVNISGGTNIPDGTYNMQFKIYSSGDGVVGGGDETLLWTESRLRNSSQGVVITDGIFQVNLGAVTSLPGSVDFNNSTLWLSMEVGNTSPSCTPFASCGSDGEMSPMVRFTSAPYAFNSDMLDGLDSTAFGQLSANNTWQGTNAFQSDIDLIFAGTQNLSVTSDLAGTVNVLSVVATPSSVAGTTRGLFVQQGNSANTNGLDNAIAIDNADTNLPITVALSIQNSGGGGYTTIIDNQGTLISGAELNLLDGRNTALVDVDDAVATAITGTGVLNAGSISAGFGAIDVGADGITTTGTIGTAGATTFTGAGATFSAALAANGGITFDNASDTIGAHTMAGTIDAANNILVNIGNAGTDFVAGTGALNLAGVLTAAGGITINSGQNLLTSNLGIQFTHSDTNPSCAAGEYKIYADTSETRLKKCMNGVVSDMDTVVGSTFIRATSDQNATAANDITLRNHNQLAYNMAPNTTYYVRASIDMNMANTTTDGSYTFTAPTGSTINLFSQGATTTTAPINCHMIVVTGTRCDMSIATALRLRIDVHGIVTTGGTGGNLQFMFGKRAANANTNPVVMAGSWMEIIDPEGSGSAAPLDFDDIYAAAVGNGNLNMEINNSGGLTFDLTTTGDFAIRSGTTAFATFNDNGSIVFEDVGTPTGDFMNIIANGGTTTSGANALQIDFTTGNGTNPTNSGLEINLTSGGAQVGDILNGINITMAAANASTQNGIVIGSNFDVGISVASGGIIITGGNLQTSNLGVQFTHSDTNPSCAAGEYKIYADTSETRLKKCMNGTVSDMDTNSGGTYIRKTTNQNATANNDTTLRNDTELVYAMPTNSTYYVRASIDMNMANTTTDGSYTFTAPTGSTINLEGAAGRTAQAPQLCQMIAVTGTRCDMDVTATFRQRIDVHGIVSTAGTAGNLQFMFGKRAANANTNPVVMAGSWMQIVNAAGADVAELYNTNDDSIRAGDVVSLDTNNTAWVKKSGGIYDKGLLGVVSTNPGLVIGHKEVNASKRFVQVALSGRVPVNVSTENGPIKPGDSLTSSSTPGVVMKATKAGRTIGVALETYNSSENGSIMMFISNELSSGSGLNDLVSRSNSMTDKQYAAEVLTHMSTQQLTPDANLSEISTDRVSAGLEIVTPRLTADSVRTNSLSAATGDDLVIDTDAEGKVILKGRGGDQVVTFDSTGNMDIVGSASIGGGLIVSGSARFNGETIFDKLVTFSDDVVFKNNVFFNNNTGGYAVIKQGEGTIQVLFPQPFAPNRLPVVTVNVKSGQFIRYAYKDLSENGFRIVLEQPTTEDIEFAWTALSITDPKTVQNPLP